MSLFVFRNFTCENLLRGLPAAFSGYGDITFPEDSKVDGFVFFYLPSPKGNQQELCEELRSYQDKLDLVITQIPSDKQLVVLTTTLLFNIEWEKKSRQVDQSIGAFNQFVISKSRECSNVRFIDIDSFVNDASQPVFDWKYYYLSQSLVSPKLNAAFNGWFTHQLGVIGGTRKKCLVLDLDNTLWGGVLGEDGMDGIALGDTYPGLAYRDFQESILEAKKNGVIIALCSKNNLDDVQLAFEEHPSVLLQWKDISAYRINWQDKASNIQELAEELNIGLDSVVFIDDNPAERAHVKMMLPEVVVPDFPDSPYLLTASFKQIYETHFQIYQLTDEDKAKTEQYAANAERKAHERSFASVDDFLQSLEMELNVQFANKFNTNRIAQMSQKTNQFNLTTKRYSSDDISSLLNQGWSISCVNVRDKFGDNGITAMAIIEVCNEVATIDSFLLSCRILGRGIERAYLDYLLNQLFDAGVRTVNARFVPSQKNAQTKNFFEQSGFSLADQSEEGVKDYTLPLQTKRNIKTYYKFTGGV